MLIVSICHRPELKERVLSSDSDARAAHRKYYAANAEKCKEALKLAYENKKDLQKRLC